MTNQEWIACEAPDLMLEDVMGTISRAQLVTFVRKCWQRVTRFLPDVPHDFTVVDQFAALADQLNDHDAAVYAAEAALKAAGLAPNLREEQRHQAELLRYIASHFRPNDNRQGN